MSNPSVLLIAQDGATQDMLNETLGEEYELLSASDGEVGLAIAQAAAPGIIFVDINTSLQEAVEVYKLLLSDEKVGSIPVIAVSDRDNVSEKLTTLSNFGGIIRCPLEHKEVISAIQLAMENKPGHEAADGKRGRDRREEPIRVLSVDDSRVIRKLVTKFLTAEGFEVMTAVDGKEGIVKAKEFMPDLILLDFVMPGMNGYQVCQALQDDEQLRDIPVILASSQGEKVGEKFVQKHGVKGYLMKPFQPEELLGKIWQVLGALEEGTPVAETSQPLPAKTESPEDSPAEPVPPLPGDSETSKGQQLTMATIKRIVQEEIAGTLTHEYEDKLNQLIKAEMEKLAKTLGRGIEKRVLEAMKGNISAGKKKQ